MSLWSHENPHEVEANEAELEVPVQGAYSSRWFGIDSALRSSIRRLDGRMYEAIMRADLRVLALSGWFPERGYKKIGAFRDAVEVMKDMDRLSR